MFLKRIDKKDRKGNNKYVQYRLCESYRINNKTRHRTIINIGRLDELKDFEHKVLADRIEQILQGQLNIFDEHSVHIEKYAQEIVKKIIESNSLDIIGQQDQNNIKEKEFVEVDINSIENHEVKEIGAEWIVKQTIDKLGIEDLLVSLGYDKRARDRALLNWISRTINPLSELGTENWLKRNSSLCELLNLDSRKISRFHLYDASRKLYVNKVEIENHLSVKTNQLFDLNDKVMLFDLTNSYFEGRMMGSKKSRFGRSKEKRSDAKIIALALVTNIYGFVKYSKIYQGNIADCNTLETTIRDLELSQTSNGKKPMIVMDAGIATEKNLLMLREKGYNYLCVSRTDIKNYQLEKTSPVIIYDQNNKPIELRKAIQEKNEDNYLYIKSEAKQKKEASIQSKLSDRFEDGLKAIMQSIEKKRGVKTVQKVYERIGRLKNKYPRVSNDFIIKTEQENNQVKKISWVKNEKENDEQGIYFIRTNEKEISEKGMWDIYNTIREIESTFRCLKTELCIRPNYHQKDENIEPHIHLGILAYQVVAAIRYQLKSKGLNDSWTTLLSKMNTQKVTTTAMMKKDGDKVFVRNCSIPSSELLEIYQKLKLKPVPFYKKRSVPPTNQ
jgi:hypothetical protein